VTNRVVCVAAAAGSPAVIGPPDTPALALKLHDLAMIDEEVDLEHQF
jgi:hypothetical protein